MIYLKTKGNNIIIVFSKVIKWIHFIEVAYASAMACMQPYLDVIYVPLL